MLYEIEFALLKETVTGCLEILLITESNLGSSFPTAQFRINGFSTERTQIHIKTCKIYCNRGFTVEPTENAMEIFLKVYSLKNSVKGPFFFENPDRFFCVDLIPTIKNKTFRQHCQNPIIRTNNFWCSALLWRSFCFLQVNQ